MSRREEFYQYIWNIPYPELPLKRYLLPSFVDGLLVVVAFFAALGLRFTGQVPTEYLQQVTPWVPLIALIYIGANYKWGIYNRLWNYVTVHDVMVLVEATGLATLLLAAINLLHGADRPLPLSQVWLGGLFTFLAMLAVRCRHFWLENMRFGDSKPRPLQAGQVRALIVGAGDHGRRLARHLKDDPDQKKSYQVVGFVDDDQSKIGLRMHGLKVLGARQQIPGLVKQYGVEQIIIVSRSSFGDSFDELVSICQKTPAQIKVVPRFCDLLSTSAPSLDLHDLTIEDLLERNPVQIDYQTCEQTLTGRVILVTGAGGSIGSELCRQLLRFKPGRLLLVDNNETSLHELYLELRKGLPKDQAIELHPLMADVTNKGKLERIFGSHRPQIVFHAAAYKHVPVLEAYPDEAVRVNLMGTVHMTELADRFGVERFIFISTDKAVNPCCAMGASKRMGELWTAAMQRGSRTRFASVRFGNVVGSRGSVVPLFSQQIEQGGPVTVTDPRMTRYFMSIPEAATLIIQASAFVKGGEIYMLDMGHPISILELAQKMIRLKGLRVGRDVRIKFIGVRPGEKLHEELAYQTERKRPTGHPKIHSLEDRLSPRREELLQQIAVLVAASQSNPEMIARLGEGLILMAKGDVDGCLSKLGNLSLHAVNHPGVNGRKMSNWLQIPAEKSLALPPSVLR